MILEDASCQGKHRSISLVVIFKRYGLKQTLFRAAVSQCVRVDSDRISFAVTNILGDVKRCYLSLIERIFSYVNQTFGKSNGLKLEHIEECSGSRFAVLNREGNFSLTFGSSLKLDLRYRISFGERIRRNAAYGIRYGYFACKLVSRIDKYFLFFSVVKLINNVVYYTVVFAAVRHRDAFYILTSIKCAGSCAGRCVGYNRREYFTVCAFGVFHTGGKNNGFKSGTTFKHFVTESYTDVFNLIFLLFGRIEEGYGGKFGTSVKCSALTYRANAHAAFLSGLTIAYRRLVIYHSRYGYSSKLGAFLECILSDILYRIGYVYL